LSRRQAARRGETVHTVFPLDPLSVWPPQRGMGMGRLRLPLTLVIVQNGAKIAESNGVAIFAP